MLSGLLVLGAAGTIMAGSGSKCAKRASATQTIESTQVVPTANETTVGTESLNSGCGTCPASAKAAVKEAGCCPSKVEGASTSPSKELTPSDKLSAEKVDSKGACGMESGAKCGSKVEGAGVSAPVEKSAKKAS